jgi:hypothetical protein
MHQPTFWAAMSELFYELHVSCCPLELSRFFDLENSIDRDEHPFHSCIKFCREIIQSTLVLCCPALPLAPPPSLSSTIRSVIESHVVRHCSAAAADFAASSDATPSRHRLAYMLPMHLLLGSLLQIAGKIEFQNNFGGSNVMSYRSSTAQWLQTLFHELQSPRLPRWNPWNAFMRQLFRLFAGLAELQVIAFTMRITRFTQCLVSNYAVSYSAKFGNSTAAAGGHLLFVIYY